MPDRIGDWMQTYDGVQFWPLDPHPSEIYLVDIAHALSNQCRFAGHCSSFYSVAQHSVLVSHIVPAQDAAWALLHDAAEAYLVDLPRPLKGYSQLGSIYTQIEEVLMLCICERFGLSPVRPESIKLADDVALMTEKRDLMPNCPQKWRETASPIEQPIIPLSPMEAEGAFLLRANELGVNALSLEAGCPKV
jgi:uncharacterized protein